MNTTMPTIGVISGGGGGFAEDEYTFSASATSHSFTVDFPIKQVVFVVANSGSNGFITAHVDVENNTAEYYWKSSTFPTTMQTTPFVFSADGKTMTYTTPSANWQYKTHFFFIG